MPSLALIKWRTDRSATLDEIEKTRRALARTRSATQAMGQQLSQAYALLLSSQFQGFCRDLHTECTRVIARIQPSGDLQALVSEAVLRSRKLDAGNPNPGNIGADFDRFGLSFWPSVTVVHPRNVRRKALLEQMNRWRNAIAHNVFDPGMLRRGQPVLPLNQVRRWRMACDGLARSFDRVMRDRLWALFGTYPW